MQFNTLPKNLYRVTMNGNFVGGHFTSRTEARDYKRTVASANPTKSVYIWRSEVAVSSPIQVR
jgi:hypothetical protein